MYNLRNAMLLIRSAIFMAMMYAVIQAGIAWGIEEKSWLVQSWEFVVGGGIGLIAGAAFFIIFGAIGFVGGAIYGAVGLLGLMMGGALGGLGLGAIVNIIRNPSNYNINSMFYVTIIVGGIVSWYLSSFICQKLEQSIGVRIANNTDEM